MRKGIISKLSLGVLSAAALMVSAQSASAQGLGGALNMEGPASALIMPFDVTDGRASFQLVSRIGGNGAPAIATHWSFWSESCDHLADVFICLTPRDTVVVDPTALQGQVQNGTENVNTGPVINLAGEKGFVTVTAFDADENSSTCSVADPEALHDTPSLIGSWVVANTSTNAAFGNNAIGVLDGQTLPDPSSFFLVGPVGGGLFLQTFNPLDLQDSEVFFIGVAFPGGNAEFFESEIGPIPSSLSNGSAVCCNAAYYDNVETQISLPDVCLNCSTTLKIAENEALAAIELDPIIPASIPAETSGFVRLTNCKVGSADGDIDIADSDPVSFLFAYHGMAVGPFGTAVMGRYTAE
jgi:hypothetical protein